MVSRSQPSFVPRGTTVKYYACILSFSLLVVVAISVAANEPDDDESPWRAGLLAEYHGDEQRIHQRVDFTPTKLPGAPFPDYCGPTDAWTVTWRGRLFVQVPGEYHLAAFAGGRVHIRLAEKTLLDRDAHAPAWLTAESVPLDFGYHPLEITLSSATPQTPFRLFWAGPQFSLEPIPSRLFWHDRTMTPRDAVERAVTLTRALRCNSCHLLPSDVVSEPLAAPSLAHQGAHIQSAWLIDRLTSAPPSDVNKTEQHVARRRMPYFAMPQDDALAIASYLASGQVDPSVIKRNETPGKATPSTTEKQNGNKSASPKKGEAPKPHVADAEHGRELFVTVGCLACHAGADLGHATLFGGGDLSAIARKRPSEFFSTWLAQPQTLNPAHRMPVFELSADEREDLVAWLSKQVGAANSKAPSAALNRTSKPELIDRGRELFRRHQCDRCHEGPGLPRRLAELRPTLELKSWESSCVGAPDSGRRPGYQLAAEDRADLRRWFVRLLASGKPQSGSSKTSAPANPQVAKVARPDPFLLEELNCVACHVRDDRGGISSIASEVIAKFPELATQLPVLQPIALTSVGEKLEDAALQAAIARQGAGRRPWLRIRMPRFPLPPEQLDQLVAHFVAHDRLPPNGPHTLDPAPQDASALALGAASLRTAGGRLVTADGFGCTSCHQLGHVVPPNAPLNARAPDLSNVGQRIRRSWFERWVRNPARIVPRMEMPSLQLPIRGILDDHLPEQISAVWHVLNVRDFEPPEPNPVQTLRLSGLPDAAPRGELVTDLVQADGRTWIKPLLIGLPNRHNLLFDLESNRLARWSLGDVARQRTKGKSWYWEAAGSDLLQAGFEDSEFTLLIDGKSQAPLVEGQFPTEVDAWVPVPGGFAWDYRLRWPNPVQNPTASSLPLVARVRQTVVGLETSSLAPNNGFRREWNLKGLPADAVVELRILSAQRMQAAQANESRSELLLPDEGWSVRVLTLGATITPSGVVHVPVLKNDIPQNDASGPRRQLTLEYRTTRLNDQFPVVPPTFPAPRRESFEIAPGLQATRLPLPAEQMPTALAWRPDGTLVIASLKGRVWQARDTDGDQYEDQLTPLSDELAAPYGLATGPGYVDVTVKYAVLRLWDEDGDGRAERTETLASGWGHTADYHDWTVGLPRDEAGCYYIGLACQQDKRSAAAATWRGTVLKLVPRTPTDDDPRRFATELISGGHRFPMGIVRRADGAIFVTDNQGNYNPFNELNHVRSGRRYGFINALEQRPDFQPPIEPPAIEIPHPWTRSVNGICLLESPPGFVARHGREAFGPFTGQLVGCEYDTRRLVRISLQAVGDTFQGAVYPLTLDQAAEDRPGLLGPLCAAVSPQGHLYLGGIRDSGWGGGNNVGEIVRLNLDANQLPAGIAEVRATRTGFEIDFTRPVDRERAAQLASYQIESYRRVATPAYGGPDVERRPETVTSVEVAPDARRVTLQLKEVRQPYVYELRLQNLAPGGGPFHPAEAYFTRRFASP